MEGARLRSAARVAGVARAARRAARCRAQSRCPSCRCRRCGRPVPMRSHSRAGARAASAGSAAATRAGTPHSGSTSAAAARSLLHVTVTSTPVHVTGTRECTRNT